MSIRLKIVLVVIPLVLATLLLTGVSSFFSATTGITAIGRDFLGFKAEQLEKQADSQWSLLLDNGLSSNPQMVSAAQAAVEGYARSIVRSATEVILAVDREGTVRMSTGPAALSPAEQASLARMAVAKSTDLATVAIAGRDRVVKGFWFEPFGWYLLATEERAAFYSSVDEITWRTGIILAAAIAAAVALTLLLAGYLTRPITRVVRTMQSIISTGDLSERAAVEYHDEIGQLAQTFNLMTGELEKAYARIKRHAYEKVKAQKQEEKLKIAFRSYVPADVIEELFRHPEQMLVGRNEVLAVLFCGLSNFSDVTEKLDPYAKVTTLNRYLEAMVDVIAARHGIVDKYIEHTIMALFGAPVKREKDADAVDSVLAGLEMIDALALFNAKEKAAGGQPLAMGIGINYGFVTVGNIGTEKKMDYTVIGDMVNLASRLQGLTKRYGQDLIISESLHYKVKDRIPCRLIDTVAVKGRKKGIQVYTAARALDPARRKAWDLSEAAMQRYSARDFRQAASLFGEVQAALPGDLPSGMLLKRCRDYAKNPPPPDWDGVEVMKTK